MVVTPYSHVLHRVGMVGDAIGVRNSGDAIGVRNSGDGMDLDLWVKSRAMSV